MSMIDISYEPLGKRNPNTDGLRAGGSEKEKGMRQEWRTYESIHPITVLARRGQRVSLNRPLPTPPNTQLMDRRMVIICYSEKFAMVSPL